MLKASSYRKNNLLLYPVLVEEVFILVEETIERKKEGKKEKKRKKRKKRKKEKEPRTRNHRLGTALTACIRRKIR